MPLFPFSFGPGACCCPVGCLIFSDNFNRADSTTIGAWTEISGGWWIYTNRLFQTDPGGGITLATATAPTAAMVADVVLKNLTDGDVYGLIMASDSGATNYHKCELEVSTLSGSLIGTLRLKHIDTLLIESGPLPIYDPTFVRLTAWIDAEWFCGCASHIGGDCTCLQADPHSMSDLVNIYAGLIGSEDTYFDDYALYDHYVHNPLCEDCACICTQDGVEHRMPFELLLTVTGTHACSTAAGEVRLKFKGDDCNYTYASDPATATGCLVDFDFVLSCDWTCVGSTCTGGSLWVTDSANCGCPTPCQLSGTGTCDPMAMVFCRGTSGGVGGCDCCTGPAEPPPQYYFGDICFTITEVGT